MPEDSDLPSNEPSSMPTPRGTGWHPQSPSPQSVESHPSISPNLHTASHPQNQPAEPVSNFTHPAFGTGVQQPHVQTAVRSSNGKGGRTLALWFWGIVILVTTALSLLLGPDALLDMLRHNLWDLDRLVFFIIPAIDVFAIVIFARLRNANGVQNSTANGNMATNRVVDHERMTSHQGEVHSFSERHEQGRSSSPPKTVWSFRVDCYEEGKLQAAIPVEMRGKRFDGWINEGDTVILSGRWRKGKIMHPKRVFNVSNNAVVKARKVWI